MPSTGDDAPRPELSRDTEHQLIVVEPPHITGPYVVAGNPVAVQYEVVARLALPARDAQVIPTVSFSQESRGAFLDVQWTTEDPGEPRGIWERTVTITVPRQFAVRGFTITDERRSTNDQRRSIPNN